MKIKIAKIFNFNYRLVYYKFSRGTFDCFDKYGTRAQGRD